MSPAGIAWCLRYPTSVSMEALADPFRTGVKAMHASLIAGGAEIIISATWRPAERAYLMHWACMIALSGQDPATVPAMAGVDIDWTCAGNIEAVRAAASAMISKPGYNIAFPAALVSRHTQRRAVDWTIKLKPRPEQLYQFRGGDQKSWMFGSGDTAALYRFGKTFGVIKLQSDPPHWSDDGR